MIANQVLEQVLDSLGVRNDLKLYEEVNTRLKHVFPNTPFWKDPEDLQSAILEIGKHTNKLSAAEELVDSIQERLNILTHKMKFIASEHRSKVMYLQDINPIVEETDPYLDKLIHIAGGIPHTLQSHPTCNPDVLILVSDKNTSEILAELPNVFSSGIWKDMNAVRNNRIYIIHNSKYLRNGGLDLVDDAEILAEIINSGYFIFGRDQDVWMNFSI